MVSLLAQVMYDWLSGCTAAWEMHLWKVTCYFVCTCVCMCEGEWVYGY